MPDRRNSPPQIPGEGIWTNDNFDARIRSVPSWISKSQDPRFQLERGNIISAFPKASTEMNRYYILNFLYNPSVVNVSHSINAANQVAPAYTRSDFDKGTPLVAAGGSLSFSLLFDRTYEMSDPAQQGTFAGTYGVMADIHVLYNLVGINTKQLVGHEADKSAPSSAVDSKDVIGVMQMNPVIVHFGRPMDGGYRDSSLPNMSMMRYFGYLTSLNITYSHFSQRMMPVRCAVAVNMDLMSSQGWAV
jgi:hypothetical protein